MEIPGLPSSVPFLFHSLGISQPNWIDKRLEIPPDKIIDDSTLQRPFFCISKKGREVDLIQKINSDLLPVPLVGSDRSSQGYNFHASQPHMITVSQQSLRFATTVY